MRTNWVNRFFQSSRKPKFNLRFPWECWSGIDVKDTIEPKERGELLALSGNKATV